MITTYGLVVLSAVLHAYWNFLLKQRGASAAVVGLSKVAEVVVFAPVFLAVVVLGRGGTAAAWREGGAVLVVVGAALTLVTYATLARAYRHGDLSLVYPVSRGSSLLFLPALGALALGESVDRTGWLALALILAGLAAIQAQEAGGADGRRGINAPALGFALLAGLTTAGYTVWDKHAVSRLPPFTYFYAYSVLVAAAFAVYLARLHPADVLRAEWRAHRGAIVQVGVFNTVAYLLVLVALQTGTSSYVIAIRQLSIVFGVGLGWWQLREPVAPVRRAGVLLLVAGCALVALAH